MKPKSPWGDAHIRLKRLYDGRVPPGMTQKEFGRLSGIGSQSMVAQYLNGIRPLNYDVAAAFAKALDCTIYDICPEMADSIKNTLLPVLGKTLRRAAAVMLAVGIGLGSPSPADASPAFNISASFLHIVRRLRRWVASLLIPSYNIAKLQASRQDCL